jgi:hypothetical protein
LTPSGSPSPSVAALDELRSSLDRGIHQENVRAMLDMSTALAEAAENPLAFYVLASVFGDLDSKWSGRPVESSQATAAEEKLLPRLRQLLFAIQRDAAEPELVESMNRLVASFIKLQQSGSLG